MPLQPSESSLANQRWVESIEESACAAESYSRANTMILPSTLPSGRGAGVEISSTRSRSESQLGPDASSLVK